MKWLLLVGAARHYLWPHFPVAMQGMASKGLGAMAILILLAVVWWQSDRSRLLTAILLWWAWEETQVAMCSIAYMHAPWPVEPGQAICHALTGLDVGAFGVLFVAILSYRSIGVRHYTTNSKGKRSE